MEAGFVKLTVYFDGQFWIGIFEKVEKKKLSACRFVFGAEPKETDVFYLIVHQWQALKFSPAVALEKKACERKNPKARQRKVKESLENCSIGTKAQQAIKLQNEERKAEKKLLHKELREKNKILQYALRQRQKHEKHKGH